MNNLVLSEENMDRDIKILFEYYRKTGFPNYNKSQYDLNQQLNKVKNAPSCFDAPTKIFTQSMVGCGILWTYFPHWISVECNGHKSLQELWENDDELLKLIRKTYIWKLKHNEGTWTNNRMRQNAKVYMAKQSVSNFRPTVAKDIYNLFGNNGKVLDMCSGFGGRLLGFAASDCCEYVGTDPSTKTYDGLVNMKCDLDNLHIDKNITIHNSPFEDLSLPDNYFDLAFTSPPYFNTEKYSNESTNSCNRYQTIDYWIDGFLIPMIQNAKKYVRHGGYVIVNIASVKSAPQLSEQCLSIMNDNLRYVDTYKMALSSISGRGVKYEPVYVFMKQ